MECRGSIINFKKIINSIIPIVLIIVWLMPVSESRGILNSGLNNRMYMCVTALVCFMVIYDVIDGKKIKKNALVLVLFSVFLLVIFSALTGLIQPKVAFGWREFAIYLTMLLIIGYRFTAIKPNKMWRVSFYIASTVIGILGLLMLLGNTNVWDFFAKYYVNHYSYVYEEFELLRKPVTFFAANSITCTIYFLIYFIWELCESKRHRVISIIYRMVYIVLIAGCFNNSAILCLGLIVLYYLLSSSKYLTKIRLFVNVLIVIVAMIILICNMDYITSILFSEANGILGRYSSAGAGNLIDTIRYIMNFHMPIGCMLIPDLYITDSGFIVTTLRGSVILTVVVYYLLYTALRYYTEDVFLTRFFFIAILAFEVGYPILVAQRFVPILCFFLLYVKNLKDSSIKPNRGIDM